MDGRALGEAQEPPNASRRRSVGAGEAAKLAETLCVFFFNAVCF